MAVFSVDLTESDLYFYSNEGCPYCYYHYINVEVLDGGVRIYTCGDCGDSWVVTSGVTEDSQ